MRPLVIFGAGGHAVSVANVALAMGYTIRHFVDAHQKGGELLGFRIIGDLVDIADLPECSVAIAIGDNAARERVFGELAARRLVPDAPALVHPSATVSFFTTLGEGTVVMPRAVVGPNTRVGRFCIVNTGASIDHDGAMADFSSLAPGVVTGGGVSVGRRSAVSIGAVLKHRVRIGDDCVVGAQSYVDKDIADNVVAYGTPARQVRTRQAGDAYL